MSLPIGLKVTRPLCFGPLTDFHPIASFGMSWVSSATQSNFRPLMRAFQCERPPIEETLSRASTIIGSCSKSLQESNTSAGDRAICRLFSRRRIRLEPPAPTRLATSAPPTAVAAPQGESDPEIPLAHVFLLMCCRLGAANPTRRLPSRTVQLRFGLQIRRDVSARIYIGTSGWHYKHWVGTFYPPKMPASKMFAFYQQHFDTVELNNSFYRLPTAEAFVAWREAAPDNFCFAVKGSRFLTHNKKLKETRAGAAESIAAG